VTMRSKSGRPLGRPQNRSDETRLLFSALLDTPRSWRYGYELSKATGLGSGTLYPMLTRLAGRGLLESRWRAPEIPGVPPRHVYRLNARGAACARSEIGRGSLPDLPLHARAIPKGLLRAASSARSADRAHG
jgi:PadR family transcriptional regulator PadR